MAAFYFSNGPSSGGAITMYLTIVGEVSVLNVTSSPSTMGQPVPVNGFQACLPSQTVECGPVPLQFLPLTANGLGCGPGGAQVGLVPTVVSASPNDPGGPGPWCGALTAGGTFTYTTQPGGAGVPGGGSPPAQPFGNPATPREVCDAAQNSYLLELARSRFDYACRWLRSNETNIAAYSVAAATAGGIAAALIGAAVSAGNPWVALALAILAAIAAAVALVFTALALAAAAEAAKDRQRMADAQTIWRNAIASVRRSCCPEWIVIQTDDLVCN